MPTARSFIGPVAEEGRKGQPREWCNHAKGVRGNQRFPWYVSMTLTQLGLEFREENAHSVGWGQRLL
jgi:hypothetical protein